VPWATAGGTTTSLSYTRQRLGHAHPAVRYVWRAACSPWSPPFPPPTPQPLLAPCSRVSSVLCWCLTSP